MRQPEPLTLTDESLMLEVRKGSVESFKVLYERYVNRILRYVHHIIGHRETAEDCTHDVFIHMFNKAGYYDPKRKFSPWLYRIARNLTLNAARKLNGQRTISLNLPTLKNGSRETLENVIESQRPGPCEIIESKEIAGLLRQAISRLSERDRQIVVLCAIEKMPHKEVAQIMDWSQARVTLQLHRAKLRLSKILEKYQSNGRQKESGKTRGKQDVQEGESNRKPFGSNGGHRKKSRF